MARVDEAREDRDKHPIQLPAMVDCPECDTVFAVVFTAQEGVFDLEDLIDAPVMVVTCPGCEYAWTQDYEGWIAHSDAG